MPKALRVDDVMQYPIPSKEEILFFHEEIKDSIQDGISSLSDFQRKPDMERYETIEEIQKVIFELKDSQMFIESMVSFYDENKPEDFDDLSEFGACFVDPNHISENKSIYEKFEQSKFRIKEMKKLQAQLMDPNYKQKTETFLSLSTNQNNIKNVNGIDQVRVVPARSPLYAPSATFIPYMRDQKISQQIQKEEADKLKKILRDKESELQKIATEIAVLKMKKAGDDSIGIKRSISGCEVPKSLENIFCEVRQEIETRRELQRINEESLKHQNHNRSCNDIITSFNNNFYNLDDQREKEEREAFNRNVTEKLLEIQSAQEKLVELNKLANNMSSSSIHESENQMYIDRNNIYHNLTGGQNNLISKSTLNKGLEETEMNKHANQKRGVIDDFHGMNPQMSSGFWNVLGQSSSRKGQRPPFSELNITSERSTKSKNNEAIRMIPLDSDSETEEELERSLSLKSQIQKNTQMLKDVENCLNVLNDNSLSQNHNNEQIFGSQRGNSRRMSDAENQIDSNRSSSIGQLQGRRLETSEIEIGRNRNTLNERERMFEAWPNYNLPLRVTPEVSHNNSSQLRHGYFNEARKFSKVNSDQHMFNDINNKIEQFQVNVNVMLEQQNKMLQKIIQLFSHVNQRLDRNESALAEIKNFISNSNRAEEMPSFFHNLSRSYRSTHTRQQPLHSYSHNNNNFQPKIFNPTVIYGQGSNSEYAQPFVPVRDLWQNQQQNPSAPPNYATNYTSAPEHINLVHPNGYALGNNDFYNNRSNNQNSPAMTSNHSNVQRVTPKQTLVAAMQLPSSSTNNSMLNNQVTPGTRANNYWDNFRSYSRQNMLSSPKSNSHYETRLYSEDNSVFQQPNNFNRLDQRPGKNPGNNNNKILWGNHFVENMGTKKRNKDQKYQQVPFRSNSASSSHSHQNNDEANSVLLMPASASGPMQNNIISPIICNGIDHHMSENVKAQQGQQQQNNRNVLISDDDIEDRDVEDAQEDYLVNRIFDQEKIELEMENSMNVGVQENNPQLELDLVEDNSSNNLETEVEIACQQMNHGQGNQLSNEIRSQNQQNRTHFSPTTNISSSSPNCLAEVDNNEQNILSQELEHENFQTPVEYSNLENTSSSDNNKERSAFAGCKKSISSSSSWSKNIPSNRFVSVMPIKRSEDDTSIGPTQENDNWNMFASNFPTYLDQVEEDAQQVSKDQETNKLPE